MAKKKVFQISNALTEGLEETITAAHQYSGELRVDVISIKRIELDPDNPRDLMLNMDDLYHGIASSDPNYLRKTEELASLQTMANSIREQGIINPVVVYKYTDKYRLVAGERRTLASILAGKTDIQAKILESKPDELKISLLQWIENVERSDLTLWERLRNLEKIIETYAIKNGTPAEEISITEISQLLGCTKPHAMNYKAVLFANDTLKQLIRDNKIRNLEKAALIANTTSPSLQQHAINCCLEGAPLKKLKTIVNQGNVKAIATQRAASIQHRGRQASAVSLGVTKDIRVAKFILDAVMQHKDLAHLQSIFDKVDWDSYQSITQTFKSLIKRLEELHA